MQTACAESTVPLVGPLLYSFRRCPYAIRARFALRIAGVNVDTYEVSLRDKPAAMLALSPKGTVPVMLLPDGRVLEQSLDIMRWALQQDTQRAWLNADGSIAPSEMALIAENDGHFKMVLDRYKYPDRHPEYSLEDSRAEVARHFSCLDALLDRQPYLGGLQIGIADLAISSFIRQCAAVDADWFATAPFPALRKWLQMILDSEDFLFIMQKPRVQD